MPSAGFFGISFVAGLLVFLPSVVFFAYAWRSGVVGRAFSLLAFALFLSLAWLAFTDPEATDFETGAAILYLIWGVTLYLGVFVFLGFKLVHRFGKRFRAWTQR